MKDDILTICYPTYKRPKRVKRLLSYYSSYLNPNVRLLLSNNDLSSPPDVQNFSGSIKDLISINNPNQSRIGDNIISCLMGANSEYALILSDEDLLIGQDELKQWLHIQKPDFFVLPAIKSSSLYRECKEGSNSDILQNRTGNLSGIGFKLSKLDQSDFEFGLALDNNDYIHIILMALMSDRQGKGAMPVNSYVLMEEDYHDGKENFFMNRKAWFSFDGRFSQFKSFEITGEKISNPSIKESVLSVLNKDSFAICFRYGFLSTLVSARREGRFFWMLSVFFRSKAVNLYSLCRRIMSL